MIKYMYIDESGDLGTQSKHLILSALIVDNPANLDRIVKNMRRHTFRKELRMANEIKANKSSEALIIHMLERLNDVPGARVLYVVLDKTKLRNRQLFNDKNALYDYVAGKLAQTVLFQGVDLEVRIDKSKRRQVLRERFNEEFTQKIKERSSVRAISIFHNNSESWVGLQFADVLAWSAFQQFEYNDSSYVGVLRIPQDVQTLW